VRGNAYVHYSKWHIEWWPPITRNGAHLTHRLCLPAQTLSRRSIRASVSKSSNHCSDGVIIIDDYHSTKRSKNDSGPDDGEAPVIVSLVEAAMQMFSAAIDALPDTSDPEFSGRANVILSGLRKLQTALTKAASRGRATPSVIVSLSGVRTRYDELMAMASEAPGATLGQQLYVVRRRAKLSAQEAANGVGLTPELLDAIEAEEVPTDDEAARIKELLAALGG
jgi:hypothetical protein